MTIDVATLRAEIDRGCLRDPLTAQRLTQIVVLLEVADELRRKAEILLERESPGSASGADKHQAAVLTTE